MMKKKVLLVDDNLEIVENIKNFLLANSYETIIASDVDNAMQILGKSEIDLILSDIQMPGKSGIDFYNEYKTNKPNYETKFVLMTGHSDILTVENAFAMGVDELLAKPFDLESIQLVVDYLLNSERAIASDKLNFVPISISEFILSKSADYDIFIKISNKYIKVTKTGQEFVEQRLDNLVKKGLTEIYLTTTDFAKYTDLQFAISSVIHKKPLDEAKKIKAMNQLINSVSQNSVLNCMDQKLLTQSISAFENYAHVAMRQPQISNIIEIMVKENPSLAEQSGLKAIIASSIAYMWRWNTPKIQSKIMLAALLSDVGLRNQTELLKKKRFEYTSEEVKIYEQHPLSSYEQLRQIENIPEEILVVAIQHHENSTGLGFPQKITKNKIHPFSKLIHGVGVFIEAVYGQHKMLDNKQALELIEKTQSKIISEQVLKSLHILFNLDVPDRLRPLLLPTETTRLL